jgi:hypothetical protein
VSRGFQQEVCEHNDRPFNFTHMICGRPRTHLVIQPYIGSFPPLAFSLCDRHWESFLRDSNLAGMTPEERENSMTSDEKTRYAELNAEYEEYRLKHPSEPSKNQREEIVRALINSIEPPAAGGAL